MRVIIGVIDVKQKKVYDRVGPVCTFCFCFIYIKISRMNLCALSQWKIDFDNLNYSYLHSLFVIAKFTKSLYVVILFSKYIYVRKLICPQK